jgi:hypothetical protein
MAEPPKRICEREWTVYGNQEYERLAQISVLHLYKLAAEHDVSTARGTRR